MHELPRDSKIERIQSFDISKYQKTENQIQNKIFKLFEIYKIRISKVCQKHFN